MTLEKLNFEDFKDFKLLTSNLKSLVGGRTTTTIMNGGPQDGVDSINDCTGQTTFADGSKRNDTYH